MEERGVVSFNTRSLYTWGKIPRYPWNMNIGGPHSRSGLFGEENNIRPSQQPNHDPSAVQPAVSSLYLLRYLDSYLDPIIDKLVFCNKCIWNALLTGSTSNHRITHLEHFMYLQYQVQVSFHYMLCYVALRYIIISYIIYIIPYYISYIMSYIIWHMSWHIS